MSPSTYAIGDEFLIHFVWQIPNGDFIRAIFAAEIVNLDQPTNRYIIKLKELKAGRQENEIGEILPRQSFSEEHWRLVGELIGRQAAVAYETADGRPVRLRLATLTREHKYFTRFE
ncbi:MAG: hypothetical protein QNJ45_18310 [Ardenticatenaceae bacterium]|nr:hypothetical protein [Ardenticatenaceae bacterium]